SFSIKSQHKISVKSKGLFATLAKRFAASAILEKLRIKGLAKKAAPLLVRPSQGGEEEWAETMR
ncbi:MAG: hypothetical protein RR842_12430, partial [Gordonibacter sp.]|uniref:hypothetical protein n=1 Tax=Gordonibacter sp. TaxID=1968902 RepID=UPI002FC78E18